MNYNTQIQKSIDSNDINTVATIISKVNNSVKNEEEKNAIFTRAIAQALKIGSEFHNNVNVMASVIDTIIKQGFNTNSIRAKLELERDQAGKVWDNRTSLEFEPSQEQYDSRDVAISIQNKLDILDQVELQIA